MKKVKISPPDIQEEIIPEVQQEIVTLITITSASINEEPVKVIRYKMDLYTPNGLLREGISRAVFAAMSSRYSDIMRAVPSNQWSTMDEIVSNYFNMIKRLRINYNITAEQIISAVTEMTEAGLILRK